jgi:(1->4)-alpha-D-glucan 1-alpha-D-glucosylmutase
VLRLTSPGVPDIYNGDELPYLALVDPDNRRPVDWAASRAALAGLDAGPTHASAKLWVIRELLALRGRSREAFVGRYEPVEAGEDTVAFRRGDDVLVAVHVRDGDVDVDLPPGAWRDVLEGLDAVAGRRVAAVFERTDP